VTNQTPSPATSFGGARANPMGSGARGAVPGRRGRPPALVRESFRMAFADQLEFLKKVAKCQVKRKVQVATASGKVVTITIEPTIADRIRAVEVMGKFSGVATLRAEDETPEAPPESGYNLAQLTVAELQDFEALLLKARAAPLLTLPSGTEVHELSAEVVE
jgi:hypothetical protein